MSQSPAAPVLRTALGYGLVLLSPVIAWLAWIATADAYPSDARHVAWFATVALGCALAGLCAPSGKAHLTALALVAILATLTTLFLWWSSEDESGLFMVGIILAAPLVTGAAVALLLLGRALRTSRGQDQP